MRVLAKPILHILHNNVLIWRAIRSMQSLKQLLMRSSHTGQACLLTHWKASKSVIWYRTLVPVLVLHQLQQPPQQLHQPQQAKKVTRFSSALSPSSHGTQQRKHTRMSHLRVVPSTVTDTSAKSFKQEIFTVFYNKSSKLKFWDKHLFTVCTWLHPHTNSP